MIQKPMNTDAILDKYGLTRDTVTQYIDAITRLNQTETAEKLGVSRDTIHRYKNAFQEMSDQERALVIASLQQNRLLEKAAEK